MPFGGETAESYHDEGLTASIKGDIAQAVAHFEHAIELDRGYFPAYHQLAKCYMRLGDTQRAVGMLRQVSLAKPNMLAVRADLGIALVDLRKLPEARQVLGEVLRAKPDHGRAQLGLAQCAFYEGKWDEAMLLSEGLANQSGTNFAALLLLGRSATRARRVDLSASALARADKLIERFVETSPDQPEGYYLRGEVQYSQETYARALEYYNAAESRAQQGRQYSAYGEHFSLLDILARQGMCFLQLGAREQAEAIARRLLELSPDNPLARELLGQ